MKKEVLLIIKANYCSSINFFCHKLENVIGSDLKLFFYSQGFLKNLKTNESYFESGAILIYLANHSGEFYGENKDLTNQWLMIQMAYVGPMIGQHHQFHHYHPGKSSFGEERYFKIAKTIYERLDNHLSHNEYLAKTYSIADIATLSLGLLKI